MIEPYGNLKSDSSKKELEPTEAKVGRYYVFRQWEKTGKELNVRYLISPFNQSTTFMWMMRDITSPYGVKKGSGVRFDLELIFTFFDKHVKKVVGVYLVMGCPAMLRLRGSVPNLVNEFKKEDIKIIVDAILQNQVIELTAENEDLKMQLEHLQEYMKANVIDSVQYGTAINDNFLQIIADVESSDDYAGKSSKGIFDRISKWFEKHELAGFVIIIGVMGAIGLLIYSLIGG